MASPNPDEPATSLLANSPSRPTYGAYTALSLLLLINLFNYVDRQVLAAVEPAIEKEFGRSHEAMGLLATVFLFSYMLISPIFGRLADRMSRWVLVGIGVMLWSLASGASGWAGSFAVLLITRCFVGVGEAAYGPVAPTILSDLFPVSVRGKVLASFYLAIPVGSALGYALGGKIGGAFGWRAAFYAVVGPGMLLGIWSLFLRDPRRTRSTAVSPATKKQSRAPRNVWQDYLRILSNRSYLLDTLGMTAMTFAIGGIGFWMPNYIVNYRHHSDLAHVNVMFGIITVVSGLLATVVGGIVGDALRPRFPGSYFLVSAAGLLAGFPFVVLMLYVPFPAAWVMIFLAVFCLFFNTGPSNTILANVIPSSIRATAFALNIFIIHALGDAISPWAIGRLGDRYSMNTAFLFVSLMMLVGGMLWLAGIPHLQRDTLSASEADRAGESP